MVAADLLDGDLDFVEDLVLDGFVGGGGRNGLEFLVDLEETGQWRVVLDDDLVDGRGQFRMRLATVGVAGRLTNRLVVPVIFFPVLRAEQTTTTLLDERLALSQCPISRCRRTRMGGAATSARNCAYRIMSSAIYGHKPCNQSQSSLDKGSGQDVEGQREGFRNAYLIWKFADTGAAKFLYYPAIARIVAEFEGRHGQRQESQRRRARFFLWSLAQTQWWLSLPVVCYSAKATNRGAVSLSSSLPMSKTTNYTFSSWRYTQRTTHEQREELTLSKREYRMLP